MKNQPPTVFILNTGNSPLNEKEENKIKKKCIDRVKEEEKKNGRPHPDWAFSIAMVEKSKKE